MDCRDFDSTNDWRKCWATRFSSFQKIKKPRTLPYSHKRLGHGDRCRGCALGTHIVSAFRFTECLTGPSETHFTSACASVE